MALHTTITEATGLPIYFCDPHSPWQRGTNENTNGLLRQYFPKGTDLSFHGPGILDNVAAELNARPRKRHGWRTPAEELDRLLSDPSACCSDRLNPSRDIARPVRSLDAYSPAERGQFAALVPRVALRFRERRITMSSA